MKVINKSYLYNTSQGKNGRNYHAMYGIITLVDNNIYKIYSYNKSLHEFYTTWTTHLLYEGTDSIKVENLFKKTVKEKKKKGYTDKDFDIKFPRNYEQISNWKKILKDILITDVQSTKATAKEKRQAEEQKALARKYGRFASMDI